MRTMILLCALHLLWGSATLMAVALGDRAPGHCSWPPRLNFAQLADEHQEKNSFPVGSSVRYTCRPGYIKPPGLKYTSTCLQNQTWSEIQELCQRRKCKHPGEPANGRLVVSGDFLLSSSVNYICEEGYKLIGPSSRRCVVHGRGVKWTESIPVCQRIPCFPPPEIPHGTHSGRYEDDFSYGSVVMYTCEDGYPLVGDAQIYCTSKDGINGEWSGRAYCGVTECPQPKVENGKIVSGFSKTYIYNQSVTLECNNGHKISGSREIHCQMDGKWEPPLPLCERVSGCGTPEIQNGRITGAQENYEPMGAITFECDPGYVLKGNHTIECQVDNTWDPPVPVCVRDVRCQPPPEVPNGSHSNQEATAFPAEMFVKYTCDPGYALIGEATIYCTSLGTWSSPAPLCEVTECPPPEVQNGRIVDGVSKTYRYNQSVTLECDNGHKISGSREIHCQMDGKWEPPLPLCEQVSSCGTPEIQNGRITRAQVNYEPMGAITFECDPGYVLKGNHTIECQVDNTWEPPVPVCVRDVRCQPPPEVPNGSHSNQEATAFPAEMFVKYTCDPGYALIGEATIYCTSSGTWSSPAPLCEVTECPPPEVQNGRIVDGVSKTYRYNQSVTLECDNGHKISGSREIHCQMDGKWEPPLPLCEQVSSCGTPEIQNGRITRAQVNYEPMGAITFECDPGYVLKGNHTIECQVDNTWDPPVPVCVRDVRCQPPPEVPNGSHSNQEATAFPAEMFVKYTCDPGYALIGEATIYCTSSGTWSSPAPLCEVTECPPPEVQNGRIVDGVSKTYRYNQSVTLECDNGHKISGSREIHCQMDGKWEPPLPLCEQVSGCRTPEIQNGRITRAQVNYEPMGAITFECDPGYVLKGNHTIECQVDNTWDPPVPVCVRDVRCQPPPVVPNGSHSNQEATAFPAEMFVKYTCDPGYALIGEATIYCTSSGTWSSPAPLCEGGKCGPAIRLENAELLDEYKENNSFPIGSTVKYSCRPGYFRIPGLKLLLTCLRDQEWSEVQEFCKRKSCGHPGEPDNGRLIVSGDFLFGSTINYSCDIGHRLLGVSSRRCVISGKKVQWTGDIPFCLRIPCFPPPEIPHGTHSGRYEDNFSYGSVVMYTCEDGYPLVGDAQIYCTSKDGINGEWSGRAYCGVTECPQPKVENGKIVSGFSKTYIYNQSVTLECNNGHKISGSREIHCQMDGKWEPPLPLCERVSSCGTPEIQNGRITGAQENYKPMGAITFECDPGYVLKGNHTIECQVDNTWDPPVPVCVRDVRCQPPPEVPNGSHSNQEATAFPAEMFVKYTCDPGYALIGEATIYCTSSGTWSSPAPLCEGGRCGPAIRLENAELLDEYKENNSFPIGSTVKYSCRPGYFRIPGLKLLLTCLRDQEWSEIQEFCKRKSCGHPGEPDNGRLIVSGDFLFGSTINYICEEGHWLLGDSSRRCEISGRRVQWTGDLPLCQRISCSPPPAIPHGTHSGRYADDFSYGSVVMYTCEDGYPLVGDAHIYCTSKDGINGEWSGRAYCGVTYCLPPKIENGRIAVGYSATYTYNQSVTLDCKAGYKISGSREIHCQVDGTWEPPLPHCEHVSHCPLPPDIANGKHNRLAGEMFTSHMSVTYSCDPGHVLIGKASISCTTSGAWSLPLPRCEVIECPSPPKVQHGKYSALQSTKHTIGKSVRYSCEPGYVLVGEATIHCTASGVWSLPVPHCEVTGCLMPKIQNRRAASSQVLVKPTRTITFECDPGYILKGNRTNQCKSDSTWESSVPLCVREIQCQSPPLVSNGSHSNEEAKALSTGMSVKYTCDPGFTLHGEATIFCTDSGTWSLPAPLCEAMHCPLPPRIAHGRYIGKDFTYGKSVLYICDAGYSLIGKHVVTCSLQGPDSVNWTEPPKCKGCPAPSEVASGTHDAGTIEDFPYGSSVTYHCDPGYFLNGTTTIHCLTSGTWDQPAPQCNSQHSQMVQCCPPPYVQNGIHSSQETAVFTSGMSVKYKCEPGYTLTGEATVYCMASGTWSPSAPSCDVMHCPLPPSIVHGKYIGEDFTYGKTVIYACDAGYYLIGENVVTCSLEGSNYVNWTEPPKCKGCPAPPGIPNGKHDSEHIEDFPYGSSVTYNCNPGYFRSRVTMIHCLSSGTWSNPVPRCRNRQGKRRQKQQLGHEAHMQTGHSNEKKTAMGCILPQISGGKKLNAETVVEVGVNVTLECKEGYVLKGSPHVQCQPGFIWDPPVPVCKPGSYTSAAIGFGAAIGVLLLIVSGGIWLIVSKWNKVKYTLGNRKIHRGPEHQAEEQQNIPL